MSAAASPASEGGGRAEWLRVYDRMVAILRKNHRHVEALLADRSRLEALLRVQHDFWVARHGLLRGRLNEVVSWPDLPLPLEALLSLPARPAADAG
jgi:hypothetical protein